MMRLSSLKNIVRHNSTSVSVLEASLKGSKEICFTITFDDTFVGGGFYAIAAHGRDAWTAVP